jgi:hypothetical protein
VEIDDLLDKIALAYGVSTPSDNIVAELSKSGYPDA